MDYTDCLQDLLGRLIAAGFVIDWVDDMGDDGSGYYDSPTIDEAVEVMLSVDESQLQVSLAGVPFCLYIVLGNHVSEVVADYGTTRGADTEVLKKVLGEFYTKWEEA